MKTEPPEELQKREIWMAWAMSDDGRKLLRAPWKLGHSYPAEWGADVVKRPETDYDHAKMYWELSPGALEEEAPLPGDCRHDTLQPAILLPHNPAEKPHERICFIDYDDVREPETGFTDEARRLITESGAWTEVSQSGEGAHAFVRAKLPEGVSRIITDLNDRGHIEVYDCARQAAMTFKKVPFSGDGVPKAQEFVDGVIEDYYEGDVEENKDGETTSAEKNRALDDIMGASKDEAESETSPYYEVPISAVVGLRHYSEERPGVDTGPHPVHGALNSNESESTNTAVFDDEVWYCHAHDSTGRALELVACKETPLSCGDLPSDRVGELEDDEILAASLAMADCVPPGSKPPYAALREVARDLGFEVDEQLTPSEYDVALEAYRHKAYE